jgi:hypothetical protein
MFVWNWKYYYQGAFQIQVMKDGRMQQIRSIWCFYLSRGLWYMTQNGHNCHVAFYSDMEHFSQNLECC